MRHVLSRSTTICQLFYLRFWNHVEILATTISGRVKLASSCGDPSGFADIGSTATVFVPSMVPPDTETDDEHPGLHETSESECGADCNYRDP